jgi:hypothetical protein
MRFELIEAPRIDLSGERPQRFTISHATRFHILSNALNAYAASEQADAAEKANKDNIKQAQKTNDQNYQMFQEARGSKGNSLLPMYAKDAQGNPYEPKLFADTVGVYDAVNAIPPEMKLAEYQNALKSLNGAQKGAEDTVNGIYNGDLENQSMAAQGDVSQARLDQAHGTGNAALISLAKTLSDIKAVNARRGFTGDSFGKRLMEFNAQTQAAGTTAKALGDANLANATDVRAIKNNAIASRVGNVNLPNAFSQQALRQTTQPEDALLDRGARMSQIFNGFKIGPQAYRYDRLPDKIATPGWGAFAAKGAAGAIDDVISLYTGGAIGGSKGGGMGGGMMGGGGGGITQNSDTQHANMWNQGAMQLGG